MTPEKYAEKAWKELSDKSFLNQDLKIIAQAIRVAVEEEREACAQIADEKATDCSKNHDVYGYDVVYDVAETIRARGEK